MAPMGSEPATQPSFLISIDMEGDDIWSRPKQATTRNAEYLRRFQAFSELAGFKPTYLVNHEMALLEVPITIMIGRRPIYKEVARRLLGRFDRPRLWLRPDGRNLSSMLEIVARAGQSGQSYLQFTLHSSEFMPGGSPNFRTNAEIERLYDHLEILFETIGRAGYVGRTFAEFADDFTAREKPGEASIRHRAAGQANKSI